MFYVEIRLGLAKCYIGFILVSRDVLIVYYVLTFMGELESRET